METLSPEIFTKLIDWFEKNRRELPWRNVTSPYRTWVSEIMLQQTRVGAAIPYFERWMRRFPDIFTLASADEDSVLKAWEGLGYYGRARNLHAAAKIVAECFGGELPRNKKDLAALPGIGEYTVGAILSIAYGEKEPAVDGNVLRIVTRLTEDGSDISKPRFRAAVRESLRAYMPDDKTSEFTQSLFELGALICLPDAAYRCEICPIRNHCRADQNGTQARFPASFGKKEKKKELLTVFLVRSGEKVAIRRRPGKGLLAKLWEFPNVLGALSPQEVENLFHAKPRTLPNVTHVFTHVVWEMIGYEISFEDRTPTPPDISKESIDLSDIFKENFLLVSPKELNENYPIPSAFSAFKKLL